MAIRKETWDGVLGSIRNGLTQKDACTVNGISEKSFYNKVNNDLQFLQSLKKAEQDFKETHLKNIANHSKTSWQASAWLLERKFKEEFAAKQIVREETEEVELETVEDEIAGILEAAREREAKGTTKD